MEAAEIVQSSHVSFLSFPVRAACVAVAPCSAPGQHQTRGLTQCWPVLHVLLRGFLVCVVLCHFITHVNLHSHHHSQDPELPQHLRQPPPAVLGSHTPASGNRWFLVHNSFVTLRMFYKWKFVVLTNDFEWSYFNLVQLVPKLHSKGCCFWCPTVHSLIHQESTIHYSSLFWDLHCASAYIRFWGSSWGRSLLHLPNVAP